MSALFSMLKSMLKPGLSSTLPTSGSLVPGNAYVTSAGVAYTTSAGVYYTTAA